MENEDIQYEVEHLHPILIGGLMWNAYVAQPSTTQSWEWKTKQANAVYKDFLMWLKEVDFHDYI